MEYVLPVALKRKIPYVAYLHSVVPKTCEWFMEHYEIYKILFPIYFKYASKIIAITSGVCEENINLFKFCFFSSVFYYPPYIFAYCSHISFELNLFKFSCILLSSISWLLSIYDSIFSAHFSGFSLNFI